MNQCLNNMKNHSFNFEFFKELFSELLKDIFLDMLVDTGLEKYCLGSVVLSYETSVLSFLFSKLTNKSKFSFSFFNRYFSYDFCLYGLLCISFTLITEEDEGVYFY